MRVVIIGGGLIGVTTAYFLSLRGHEVAVVEREKGPGEGASLANGALLTPSMSDPWNSPGSWRVLLASLGRSDAPLQLRLRTLPSLLRWGVTFLRNSRTKEFERNTISNLRLAVLSMEIMQRLRRQTAIEFGHAARGTLRIFRNAEALESASASAGRLTCEGLSFRTLSTQATIDMEPALAPIASELAGALYCAVDESGDAYRFCVALAELARLQGVEFRFNTAVSSLEMRSGLLSAVASGRERFVADRYVVAAGCLSTPLLRPIGIRLPVQPAKGYSLTFRQPPTSIPLRIPVIDDHLHAGVVPLENAIRVVGTAEFSGFDKTLDPARVGNLAAFVKRVLPMGSLDATSASAWCGLRPMSADGVPIIGATPVPNLLLSTGHGHLGWTMAAGSGHLLAAMVSGESPPIDISPFSLSRFTGVR